MELLARDAADEGNRWIQSRALVALADASLQRDGDAPRATALLEEALQVVEPDDHAARFQALDMRSRVAWWDGQLGAAESFEHDALEAARMSGHDDFEAKAALELATIHVARMDIDRAEPLVERASELAQKSGSILTRAKVASTAGRLAVARSDDLEASRLFEQALELYTESGAADGIAHSAKELARVGWRLGDEAKAEKLLRESIRLLAPLEDRGVLCESQRLLAQLLLAKGRIDEAEKLAVAAIETVGPADRISNATTKVALAEVRAAQGMESEAEQLFAEALELVSQTEFRRMDLDVLPPYVEFLRARGRDEEAAEFEARLAELASPSAA
jgi:ATP/maltotriose-dependent transcriptional regulator MalT